MSTVDTPAPRLEPSTVVSVPAAARTTEPAGREASSRIGRWLIYALLGVVTVAFIYPFLWLLSASFKPRSQVFDNRLIPKTFTFENYLEVWEQAPMALWLFNTALVTVLATVTVTISSAMVAWGFSYFRFRGRNALFGVVLATMMLPGAVTMIPTFLIWNALGQVGTLTPLWAGNLFGSAFYIFLLRQFFLGLPRDVFDAAGGWPSTFWYAHEGIDLAWRVWNSGHRVRYAGDIVVHHPAVLPQRHADFYRYTCRNRVLLARRNLPVPVGAAYLATWVLLTLARARSSTARRQAVSGFREGFRAPSGGRRPIRWRTVWRMTRAGRPPVI